MTAAPPSITIVVPVWGPHVAYVPAAVDSLLRQRRPAFRVVVVDNCSDQPVPSLPAGAEIRRTPERLRIGAARNFGLALADTPYVMFWDADDLMLDGVLQRLAGVLDDDPDVVAVTMDSVAWTPRSGPGKTWPWPRSVMYRLAPRRRVFALIAQLYNPYTTTGPALMRTAAVRDAGGFAEDVAYFEDWALAASLTVRGRIVMLRETARWYRVHEDSLTIGHLGQAEERAWLLALRTRMRRDPRSPWWLKALLPAIRLHHLWRERRSKNVGAGVGFYEVALSEVQAAEPPAASST